jgi:hypothetical protein
MPTRHLSAPTTGRRVGTDRDHRCCHDVAGKVTHGLGPQYSLSAGPQPAPSGPGVLLVLLLAKQIGLGDYPHQLAVAVEHGDRANPSIGEHASNVFEWRADLYGHHAAGHHVVNPEVSHRPLLLAVSLPSRYEAGRTAIRGFRPTAVGPLSCYRPFLARRRRCREL